MTIDPRIPTMPGRSTSGFYQPGRGGGSLLEAFIFSRRRSRASGSPASLRFEAFVLFDFTI